MTNSTRSSVGFLVVIELLFSEALFELLEHHTRYKGPIQLAIKSLGAQVHEDDILHRGTLH